MKLRAIALASMSIALPNGAHAADDFCSRLIVQAVNQFCQLLPSGLNLCQPVALVGSNPECATPQKPTLVPIGPPTLQAAAPWAAPYAGFPATLATPPAAAAVAATERAPAPTVAATVTAPAAASPAKIPAAAVAAEHLPAPAVAAASPKETPAPPPVPAIAIIAEKAPIFSADVAAPVIASPTETLATPPAPAIAVAAPPAKNAGVTLPISPLPPATDTAWPADTADTTRQAEAEDVDALAHFTFDSADLTAAGRAVLDAWLAEAPANKKVRVSGHADRLGPEPYNLKLSLRRAQTVKQYLVGKGLAPRRVQLEAKGEAEPVKRCKGGATPSTKACLAPNRRVEVETE